MDCALYIMDEPVSIEPPAARPRDELAHLVAGMQSGNEAALEQLYEDTVSRVYALALGILRKPEDAEEVVCTTYAYAWANAHQFDTGRSTALGWLMMLCRSRSIDQWRRGIAAPPTVPIEDLELESERPHERPDQLLEMMQERGRVHSALARLQPLRRQLVSLSFLQGLSHEEITQATGLPLGTVKSHLRRALQQLRVELEAS